MRPNEPERAAAVVCHAHPLHGGVMHFKLVFRVAKALQDAGLAVLRFNFRGVGRSEGTHDDGIGEQQDVRAAFDELERRFPGLPLVASGFSFGAVVAARAGLDDARVRALALLGIPIAHLDDPALLDRCVKPRLFVQGGQDEFGGHSAIGAFVARLPEPKTLVVIDGADHYLTGRLDEAQATVAAWMTATLRGFEAAPAGS
jgi:alpha/beta superfamily hydrolase